MAINQNITKFYEQAANRDFARDILFRVTQIEIPGVSMNDDDLVYARSAQLPGRNITNVDAPYMGLPFRVPGVVSYPNSDGYSIQFYVDEQSTLRQQFENASRLIFDDQISTGQYGTPGRDRFIVLSQLDKRLEPVSGGTYKLVGVSIRNVGEIQYQMASGTGQTVEFATTFAYHFYEQIG